jgi:hypothetical protein
LTISPICRLTLNKAFFHSKLLNPLSVTTIGNYAFSVCYNLTTLNFNAGNCAITNAGWTNLTHVAVGSNVQKIPASAFEGCSGLLSVTVGWQRPLALRITRFNNVDVSNVKLIVPSGTVDAYRAAPVWKDFDIVEAGSGINVISASDPVISTQYHNLQGVAVKHPQAGQLYIVKETRQSGKVTTRKVIR